jgi:hypothetical protein
MPGFNVFDLENRSNSVGVYKFAEFMTVVVMGFAEGKVDLLALVHRDGPIVVIESKSFPNFNPYSLCFPIIHVIFFQVRGDELLLELCLVQERGIGFIAEIDSSCFVEEFFYLFFHVDHVLLMVGACFFDFSIDGLSQFVFEVTADFGMVDKGDHLLHRNERNVLEIFKRQNLLKELKEKEIILFYIFHDVRLLNSLLKIVGIT